MKEFFKNPILVFLTVWFSVSVAMVAAGIVKNLGD